MKLYYVYCLHLLEQNKSSPLVWMTSLHKLNYSITPKYETNPEFMRLKKLCSAAFGEEIIIWQTHFISFPGCWHANEAHLYNLFKWKTDNQIPSEGINIQLGVAYAKSCSWRNSKEWERDHSKKRRQTGIQNILQLLVLYVGTGNYAFKSILQYTFFLIFFLFNSHFLT